MIFLKHATSYFLAWCSCLLWCLGIVWQGSLLLPVIASALYPPLEGKTMWIHSGRIDSLFLVRVGYVHTDLVLPCFLLWKNTCASSRACDMAILGEMADFTIWLPPRGSCCCLRLHNGLLVFMAYLVTFLVCHLLSSGPGKSLYF